MFIKNIDPEDRIIYSSESLIDIFLNATPLEIMKVIFDFDICMRSKVLFKDMNLDDNKLRKAAVIALEKILSEGMFRDSIKIINIFNFPKMILFEDKIFQITNKAIAKVLSHGFYNDVLEFIEFSGCDEKVLFIQNNQEASRIGLIPWKLDRVGYFKMSLEDILNKFNISDLDSSELQKYAQKYWLLFLAEPYIGRGIAADSYNVNSLREFIKATNIPNEFFKSKEVKQAAINGCKKYFQLKLNKIVVEIIKTYYLWEEEDIKLMLPELEKEIIASYDAEFLIEDILSTIIKRPKIIKKLRFE